MILIFIFKSTLVRVLLLMVFLIGLVYAAIKLIDEFGNEHLRSKAYALAISLPGELPERFFDVVSIRNHQYHNPYKNESDNLEKIHDRILAINPTRNITIPELASLLAEGTNSDLDRLYSVYIWIISNIRYDSSAPIYQSAGDALARRIAVCDGFSKLLSKLARELNIPVIQISGHANPPTDGIPNHAWNAAMIDGRWFLMDVTWDVGNIDFGGLQYFLTDPAQFNLSHRPLDEKWLLVENESK